MRIKSCICRGLTFMPCPCHITYLIHLLGGVHLIVSEIHPRDARSRSTTYHMEFFYDLLCGLSGWSFFPPKTRLLLLVLSVIWYDNHISLSFYFFTPIQRSLIPKNYSIGGVWWEWWAILWWVTFCLGLHHGEWEKKRCPLYFGFTEVSM